MPSMKLVETVRGYENYILQNGVTNEAIDAYLLAVETAFVEDDRNYALSLSKRTKELIEGVISRQTGGSVWDLDKYCKDKDASYDILDKYYQLLKFESYDLLESFIFYMEKNRKPEKRFYEPRKETLHIVVEDLQQLENSKQKFQGVSMPSRTGKSSLCIFFLAWVALKRPNSHNAMGGHSGILARGFYEELLNMMTSPEYTYKEMFDYWNPEYANKAFPTKKSAEDYTITLGDPDRFATITCRGIDGTWTGAVDVSSDGYLYVDDLVRDREHSLSPQRMENTFQEYLNKMVDRKNDGSKELMVGTLWNVLDPLERIRNKYECSDDYRFRKIPALDENDESNFAYKINGFSTEYYREMRDRLDNAEWMAKYQQQPYVREGLLFPEAELRYFAGIVPDELRKVWAICDPAFGGADSLSMPIIYDYGDKNKYIVGWVHKQGTQAVTVPLIVNAIEKFYVTELHIEQNAGGTLLTDSIKKMLAERGIIHCQIIPYYANTKLPKAEKIKGYSDWVKDNFLFLMPNSAISPDEGLEIYKRDEQYQKAIDELCMYTSEGKNFHDDAPDVLSSAGVICGKVRKKAVILESPL